MLLPASAASSSAREIPAVADQKPTTGTRAIGDGLGDGVGVGVRLGSGSRLGMAGVDRLNSGVVGGGGDAQDSTMAASPA